MTRLNDQCPYCNKDKATHIPEVKKITGLRCLECGFLNSNPDSDGILTSGDKPCWTCQECLFSQCLKCTLEAHPDQTCEKAVEIVYTELKKVFSSVTLDPTITFQMCTTCDKILQKARICNHYYCQDCEVTFCMYCREDFTEEHMNPFTENACCLFKIGAKKMHNN